MINNYIKSTLLAVACFWACGKETVQTKPPIKEEVALISAVDISQYPKIAQKNPVFKDQNGIQKDFVAILKESGVNTLRLKLWVNPQDGHSSFEEVRDFAHQLKQKGFKIWLTLHYSDTWADPGRQELPNAWKNLDFTALKDTVFAYTTRVMRDIRPDLIQIGNETNSGFLHPHGNLGNNQANFVQLIQAGCAAVRQQSKSCKIILHYAGLDGSSWFFDKVKEVDYDVMGLSYYYIWHQGSLSGLRLQLRALTSMFGKETIIAETAYPFTLMWNDWTNNIVGLEDHLMLPSYPATPDGQRDYVADIKKLAQSSERCLGFCYWGGELIAWDGPQSKEGSPWENQALFDFDLRALPALLEFRNP